ncbi:MAG: NACHT domain-containing protein [Theionarchaea archaeon]|nr:NACHT domain-containing protein [Theionarchaea archaeon]
MNSLTPLTEMLPSGSEGGTKFENLMHQLLLEEAKRRDVRYEPTSGPGGDRYGVDGRVAKDNLLGIDGPFGVEFKWLWNRVDKKKKSRQIEEKLQGALREFPEMRTWVLVTPLDFTPAEQKWFDKLPEKYPKEKGSYRVVHWGKTEIDNLLYNSSVFLARFYPAELPKETDYKITDFNTFLDRYRTALIAEYETLRLIGIPTRSYEARDQQRPVPLRKIFIPQNFRRMRSPKEREKSLDDILEDEKKTKIVLGDPGSGKTTLLTFLTLLFCGEANLKDYKRNEELVPILVPIREFVRAKSSNFVDFIVQKTRDFELREAHPYFFEYLLRMGEAVVLFDGLDEVGKETDRAKIARAIKRFSRLYPNSQIWVTSRFVGYSGDVRLPPDQFQHYEVAPLDKKQIETFIKNWYEIQVPHNERIRVRRINSMVSAINIHPRVQRLAANPLLLTLMALIHQHETQLPRDRGALYDKCIEMLIFRWQQRKDEELGQSNVLLDELNMPEDTVRRYLAGLAFWIQTENENIKDEEARGLVDEQKLLDFLTEIRTDPERGRDKDFARQEMIKFIDYIRDRAGLLIEKGTGQFAFAHLSFLEFLAAQAKQIEEGISDDDRIKFILEHLDKPSWREVILLLLYLIGSGSEQFLDEFTKRAFSYIREHKTDEGWETLGKMLSDNLSLKHADADEILNELFSEWSKEPRCSGRWYDILNNIALFADRYEDRLRNITDNQWKTEAETKAIPALILRDTLFGWDSKITEELSNNAHFKEFAHKLLPFYERENMGNLLDNNTTLIDWFHHRCETSEYLHYFPFFVHSIEDRNEFQLEAELAWTWREILIFLSKLGEFSSKKDIYSENRVVVKFSAPGLEFSYPIYSPLQPIVDRIVPLKSHSMMRIDIANSYTGAKAPEETYYLRRMLETGLFRSAFFSCFEFITPVEDKDKRFMDRFIEEFMDRFMDPRFMDRFMDRFIDRLKDPRFIEEFMDPRFIEEFMDPRFIKESMDYRFIEEFMDPRFIEEFTNRFMDPRFMDQFIEKSTNRFIYLSQKDWEELYRRWTNEWRYSWNVRYYRKSSRTVALFRPVIESSNKRLDEHLTSSFFERFKAVDNLKISITNPFFIPLALYLISMSGFIRTMICISLRFKLNSTYRSSKDYYPIFIQLFEIFFLSLSWDSVASYYQQQNSRPSDLKGALFLSQTALASLMGGFTLGVPHRDFMSTCIQEEDMRLKVSKVLYDIVRQPERIDTLKHTLREIVDNMKDKYVELLLCAGLLNEKYNCTVQE